MSGLQPQQLLEQIARPTLNLLDIPGTSGQRQVAERLVMGTGAHESMGFTRLHQDGKGPALGLFQMEPATFYDLWRRTFERGGTLWATVSRLRVPLFTPPDGAESFMIANATQLAGNHYLAVAMCRIHYFFRPFTMPETASAEELALIWKTHYNTMSGAGKPSQFVAAYNELVAPLYPKE